MKNSTSLMYKCDACGAVAPSKSTVYLNGSDKLVCVKCASKLGTCAMCIRGNQCEFLNNPAPIPHQVQTTVREGNMVISKPGPNPQRIKAFCIEGGCKCMDLENKRCMKHTDHFCAGYEERF